MGKTGVHAGLIDALGDTGPMQQDHVTADLQVVQHARLAAGYDPVSYPGRSSHDKTGGQQAVPADFDVVGNVAEVVELGAGADPGCGVGCPIDATAGSDGNTILAPCSTTVPAMMAVAVPIRTFSPRTTWGPIVLPSPISQVG
jgi:hypothetical protein